MSIQFYPKWFAETFLVLIEMKSQCSHIDKIEKKQLPTLSLPPLHSLMCVLNK